MAQSLRKNQFNQLGNVHLQDMDVLRNAVHNPPHQWTAIRNIILHF